MAAEWVVCGVPFGTPGEKDALRKVKDRGFTSVGSRRAGTSATRPRRGGGRKKTLRPADYL